MKFCCNDATDHATCFANCEGATGSQIDLFTSCVTVSTCDPACSPHIAPKQTNPPPNTGSDCPAACGRLVSDGCLDAQMGAACNQVCTQATAAEISVLLSCESRRSGCDLPAECAAMLDGVSAANQCKASCDKLAIFGCIGGTDSGRCQQLCDKADAGLQQRFISCANAGICKDDSCFKLLDPNGASADVSGCREACDDMKFFSCLSASEHTECRSTCAKASADAIETFKSCVTGVCKDTSCYDLARSAPAIEWRPSGRSNQPVFLAISGVTSSGRGMKPKAS
jgi:hypothetical protein